jgi:general secretion pathway protein E
MNKDSQQNEELKTRDYPSEPIPVESFTLAFMLHNKVVPINTGNDFVEIATADCNNRHLKEAIGYVTGKRVIFRKGKEDDILDVIERLYGTGASSMDRIVSQIEDLEEGSGVEENNIEQLKDMASEAPVIRLVNLIISRAIEVGATDIHFEPFENRFVIRYRIDGVLQDVESPPKRLQGAIISRVKIMAKMNIAERRLPQDGRLKLWVLGKEIDFRISTIPIQFGESLVMRILDQSRILLDLYRLGFPADTLETFREMLGTPYGLILVSGPTGSGKTTTLYSALQRINLPERKIITIEDPVEYQLSGINQIQVKPQIGLTFANGLRSIVRQDPDIILVGEIRDAETAEISIQSALTGHLVFSTLHTNDAAGSITRLLEMGVEDYLLASSLVGVMAQRLVRVLCPHCREKAEIGAEFYHEMGVDEEGSRKIECYKPVGCEDCRGTGFRGRTGIYELLRVTEGVRELILNRESSSRIKKAAIGEGMRTLREDGWSKVKQGLTTISEVLRVTMEE